MLAWFSVRRRWWLLLLLLVGLTGGDVVGVGVTSAAAAAAEPQQYQQQQYQQKYQQHRRSFSSWPVSSSFRTTTKTTTTTTTAPTSSHTRSTTRDHNNTRSSLSSSSSSSWTKTHRSSWFGYGVVVGVSVAKKQKHQKSKSQQHHPDPPYNNIDANKILLTNRRASISPPPAAATATTTTATTTILDVRKIRTILQQVFLILVGSIVAIPLCVLGCVVCLGAVPLLVYIWGRTLLIELLTTSKHQRNETNASLRPNKVIPVPMTIALSGLVILLCGLFVDYHFPVGAAFATVVEKRTTLFTLAHNTMTTQSRLLLLLGLLEGGCFVRRAVMENQE